MRVDTLTRHFGNTEKLSVRLHEAASQRGSCLRWVLMSRFPGERSEGGTVGTRTRQPVGPNTVHGLRPRPSGGPRLHPEGLSPNWRSIDGHRCPVQAQSADRNVTFSHFTTFPSSSLMGSYFCVKFRVPVHSPYKLSLQLNSPKCSFLT